MKWFFLFTFIVCITFTVGAQDYASHRGKPPIDSSVYKKWTSVESPAISNDGKYVSYIVRNQPVGSRTLVIKTADGLKSMEIPNASGAVFTQDNRFVIFKNTGDSLGILSLGSTVIEYLPKAGLFKVPSRGMTEWFVYQQRAFRGGLVVRNLSTKKEQRYTAVKDYLLSSDGKTLVLLTDSIKDGKPVQSISRVNLFTGNTGIIWEGSEAGNLLFDGSETQFAFASEEQGSEYTGTALWYYKEGMQKAEKIAGNGSPGIDSGLVLGAIDRFSNDGSRLFINLKQKEDLKKPNPNAVKLTIWSYKDVTLQSYQSENRKPQNYKAIIDINNRRVVRLEQRREMLNLAPPFEHKTDDISLVSLSQKEGENIDISESSWNTALNIPTVLISTKDGSRKAIKALHDLKGFHCQVSPKGKYVVYYDGILKSYFSYEIASHIKRNITKGIATVWKPYDDDYVNAESDYYPVAGWLENDDAVFLYDQYDIWKVDLDGKRAPVNITNGYGRDKSIFFELIKFGSRNVFSNNETVLLSAFNRQTKNNGFYKKTLTETGNPKLLSMGHYFYYAPLAARGIPNGQNFIPIKARDAEVYLVRRMNASESPNIFVTTDFRNFSPISDVRPEKNYNWFTTELHQWKTKEGRTLQGVLYKPEDFNPGKKYPVIFHCYEIKSNGLNIYTKPEPSDGDLNIPWFVSNGYLVFEPDIHFKIGELGKSVNNAVSSAAGHLEKMPYVDARKMGVQGHSFGGYDVNYLVTHTHFFAAACVGSGGTDFISYYNDLHTGGRGSSQQNQFETGPYRMGATLWERPDLYIENSPVFQANKVTTPLLIFHTTIDGAVPFRQAIEFFTALRRLGKKVWMLEYEEGNHGVFGKSADDFSIRMAQFFDYYLKGIPAPRWMIDGIPVARKGVDNGLELDTNSATP